jgi:CheY-like chemotaxis protein
LKEISKMKPVRRTILLADDSPTIRRLVIHTFADANVEIIEVNNGDAAIKSLEEVRPSVVLADIYLPGKNGYQVCSYVRSHPQLSRTPVVLLVGAFDAFDAEAAQQVGATASITKPFEPGALIDLVMSVMPSESATVAVERQPEPEPPLEQQAEPQPSPQPASQSVAPVAATKAAIETPPASDPDDLLGLESIFNQPPEPAVMTENDIDRIADRVIQRLSSQAIESIAWDVVPDIAERIVREELKRVNES